MVENDSGCRVITTTRNRDVANMEEVYELRTLSLDHSEKLFKTRLFGVNGEYPVHQPVEASEKILKKCGGVPLAIVTMASLLVGKSREDWFDVCNSPGFYRGKGNQQADDTEWILSLSYYDLPSYLRTCLLYLSVYPEDYEVEKDSLIWKWIAEGFVEEERGTSLFQRGEEYFNQLINRSLIQAVGLGCRVHDMVLDLIRNMSDKDNFVTISSDDDDGGTLSSPKKVRRLAHHNRMLKQTQQDADDMSLAQVRSLVACRCDTESWVLHPSFKLLRVLALDRCRIHQKVWQGLKHIGHLLHLRYLGVRHTVDDHRGYYELPKEIGKLKFLRVLDLEDSHINLLPREICQLTQLVCLRGDIVHTDAPDGSFLRKLTSLEVLTGICIDNLGEVSQCQFMENIGNLRELRVLNISGVLEEMMVQPGLVQSLCHLHKLQHLELTDNLDGTPATWDWERVVLPQHLQDLDIDAIVFHQLPSWISPRHLRSLRYLRLHVDHMDESGLRNLAGLPELHSLSLSTFEAPMACTATVANITAGDGFFQKLRFCNLHGWMVHLLVNEDSTGVSFSIWNGIGAMTIGSKTKDERSRPVAPLAVMPNLQELEYEVPVRALYEDGNGICGNLALECLPSLRDVEITVLSGGASDDDVEKAETEVRKAEAELRNAAQLHPNGPKIIIRVF